NPHYLPLAALDLRQHLVQHRQLTLPTCKLTPGALPQPRSWRTPWPVAEEFVGHYRDTYAFNLERRDRLQGHLVLHQPTGRLTDQDHPRRCALLETGGQ